MSIQSGILQAHRRLVTWTEGPFELADAMAWLGRPPMPEEAIRTEALLAPPR